MYINIGANTMILQDEIIGYFDLDTTTVAKRSRDFLNRAEKEGKLINTATDLPKSFVVCSKRKKEHTIYLSQLSSVTLLKRSEEKNILNFQENKGEIK